MSFGFRSLNSSGFLQIDEDYENYALYQSGTVTVSSTPWFPYGSSNYGGTGQPGSVITLPTGIPLGSLMVAVKPTTESGSPYVRAVIVSWNSSGTLNSRVVIHAKPSTNITYKIFRKSSFVTASGSYGLSVFKSNGDLAYNSNQGAMAIETISSGNVNGRNISYNISMSSLSGKYIVCQNIGANGQVNVSSFPPAFSARWAWNAAEFNYSTNKIKIGLPTEVASRLNSHLTLGYDYYSTPYHGLKQVMIGRVI